MDGYPHVREITTRWKDNDVYGHVNNVEYYSYFDTVINAWLIREGGLDIHAGAVIGLCAESHCSFLAALEYGVAGVPESYLLAPDGTVLVISCPHALGLAIPLTTSLSSAIGARNGILVKDRLALDATRWTARQVRLMQAAAGFESVGRSFAGFNERGIDFADVARFFFARSPFFRRKVVRDEEARWQAFGPFAQGPVALLSRHGEECVFSVDALGLRPLWQIEAHDSYVFSSEPGVVSVEKMCSEPKPLAPGEKALVLIDRDIGVTLRRLYANVGWWQRLLFREAGMDSKPTAAVPQLSRLLQELSQFTASSLIVDRHTGHSFDQRFKRV